MISCIETKYDTAGFPIVSWMETRGIGSAGGPGEVGVECRITKDAGGELLFVARGPKRPGYGRHEDGRPWRLLRGFSIQQADALFATATLRQVRQLLSGKSLAAKVAAAEGAQVVSGEFHGLDPIHINETAATPASLQQLHAVLRRAFVDSRKQLVTQLCTEEEFKWPIDNPDVETYNPDRPVPSQQQNGLWGAIDQGVAGLLIAAFAALVIWVAIKLFR
jgi:hypothetical protein